MGTKVLIAGIALYTSPSLFKKIAVRILPDAGPLDQLMERAYLMRRKLWRSAAGVGCTILFVLALSWLYTGSLPPERSTYVRILAAAIALIATLGRGGWGIQSYSGTTITERIDRGMYVAGQIGAVMLLVAVLTL